MKPLIYLATPYSHPDANVRAARYDYACSEAARLMKQYNVSVISPIAHSHPIALIGGMETDFATWRDLCMKLMLGCDAVYISGNPEDIFDSIGITAEVKQANSLGIPVFTHGVLGDQFGNWVRSLNKRTS